MEDKTAEEIKRHFDVVAESLKDEIKLVAKGHDVLAQGLRTLDEKIDTLRKENTEEHALLNERIDTLRKENAEQHQEILSATKFSYAELDHRIVTLEGKFTDIEKRVSHLERSH